MTLIIWQVLERMHALLTVPVSYRDYHRITLSPPISGPEAFCTEGRCLISEVAIENTADSKFLVQDVAVFKAGPQTLVGL